MGKNYRLFINNLVIIINEFNFINMFNEIRSKITIWVLYVAIYISSYKYDYKISKILFKDSDKLFAN